MYICEDGILITPWHTEASIGGLNISGQIRMILVHSKTQYIWIEGVIFISPQNEGTMVNQCKFETYGLKA